MNLGEIQQYVLDALQDKSKILWSTPEINRLIHFEHMALHQAIANRFERFFKVQGFISETAGTTVYSLPTDVFRTILFERLGSDGEWYPLSKVELTPGSLVYKSRPWTTYGRDQGFDMYYQDGQKQITLIEGSENTATNSLRVTYIYRPARMHDPEHEPFQQTAGQAGSGTDNLTEWHDIIAMGTLAKAHSKEENWDASRFWLDSQGKRMGDLNAYLHSVASQSARYINVTEDDVLDF